MHEQLIKKCQQNDSRAQLEIYDLYSQAMYNTAYNIVKRPTVAEDMMQEAFLKAFSKIDTYEEGGSFGGWLKRITTNHCLDWIRKKRPYIVDFEEAKEKADTIEDEPSEESELYAEVMKGVEKLPSQQHIVVKLFYIEGYAHKEIAEMLEITELASRSLLHRARKNLQELFKTDRYAT